MTTQEMENRLYKFFENEVWGTEAEDRVFPEVELVRRFNGILATNDNGIVLDLADGTEIILTIQVR